MKYNDKMFLENTICLLHCLQVATPSSATRVTSATVEHVMCDVNTSMLTARTATVSRTTRVRTKMARLDVKNVVVLKKPKPSRNRKSGSRLGKETTVVTPTSAIKVL